MAKQPTKAVAADYRKHPVVRVWNKRAVERTKNGPAVFKPGLPSTPQQYAMMYDDKKVSHPIPAGSDPYDVFLYWLKFDYIVGASRGTETHYILIKRDSGKVHARPISEHELSDTFKVKP